MEYKSYSTILFSIVLIFLALGLLYFFVYGGAWYVTVIPFTIVSIALLVFKVPIDMWGFKSQDVKIDERLFSVVLAEYPEVQSFSTEETMLFRKRMFYYLYDREAYLVTAETEKLDLYHTILMSVPAIILSMKKDPAKFDDIERLAAYKHAFPSPKKQFIHSAEYDSEDGVMIISIEQLMMSLRQPEEYYHIAYQIWAERFISIYPDFPDLPADFKEKIPSIFGFKAEKIDHLMGYPLEDMRPVALTSYFKKSSHLQRVYPSFYKKLSEYLS